MHVLSANSARRQQRPAPSWHHTPTSDHSPRTCQRPAAVNHGALTSATTNGSGSPKQTVLITVLYLVGEVGSGCEPDSNSPARGDRRMTALSVAPRGDGFAASTRSYSPSPCLIAKFSNGGHGNPRIADSPAASAHRSSETGPTTPLSPASSSRAISSRMIDASSVCFSTRACCMLHQSFGPGWSRGWTGERQPRLRTVLVVRNAAVAAPT